MLYTMGLSILKDFIETVYISNIYHGHDNKLLLIISKLWYKAYLNYYIKFVSLLEVMIVVGGIAR